MGGLLRAAATVSGLTLVSRILGFGRDVIIAGVLGAGTGADAFFVAFKLPNLFRRLFAEGAFHAAFVPIFSGLLEGEGRVAARRFAERALALLVWTLLAITLVMEIVMPWAVPVLAPGFTDTAGKLALTADLARITFPYLLFIAVVALLSGMLQGVGRFAAAAAAPILLNVVLIAAALTLPALGMAPAFALAWGVAAAGVVQFLWLLAHTVRAGFPVRLPRPRLTARSRTLVRRVGPGAVGAGVYQINIVADTIFASLVGEGAVSWLYYADRITQLPLGVVGTAVGLALLPMLSRQLKAGQEAGAMDSQNRAAEFALLLTIPAMGALMVVPAPVIGVLFERGAFGAGDTAATAGALMAFALGLPAYVAVKVLAPGFFARGDTRTPVIMASLGFTANIGLNLALMGPLGHVGIALATSLAQWLNAGTLAMVLARRGFLRVDARLKSRAWRIAAATLGMAAGLWGGRRALAPLFDAGPWAGAGGLAALVLGGILVYAALARLAGAATLGELKAAMRRSGGGTDAGGGETRP